MRCFRPALRCLTPTARVVGGFLPDTDDPKRLELIADPRGFMGQLGTNTYGTSR